MLASCGYHARRRSGRRDDCHSERHRRGKRDQWEILGGGEWDHTESGYRLHQLSYASTAERVVANWWEGAIRRWWDYLNAPDKMSAQAERVEDAPKPWENIPDVGWNRKAVELWHAGYTSLKIARMIDRGLTPKTILNVISNLRRIYGTEVVPERRAKSKPGRKLG